MPRSFAPPNAGAGSGSPSSSSVNSGQSKRRSIKISPRAMRRPPLRPNRIYPAASGLDLRANFGVSDRRFRFKPAGGFGGNRQAVSVQIGTPLRMGFGPDFGEPPLRDTSYLALVCQSKYSCHYYRF